MKSKFVEFKEAEHGYNFILNINEIVACYESGNFCHIEIKQNGVNKGYCVEKSYEEMKEVLLNDYK